MGLHYTLITCMDFDHHHFCLQLELFKAIISYQLKLFCLYYFLFLFVSFRFLPVSGQFPPRKIALLRLGLGFGLSLEIGLGLGAIFLGGNCPRIFFTGGKQGYFLHANEMCKAAPFCI